ncbi:hypothetical protein FB451DRAFT_1077544 [Mycena latifolia]|nr:hypothetical protein FB451DRAFT_1077544 [Mycena latifolia]
MPSTLLDLHDDVLISLLDLLDIPEILVIRQTCKRMQEISELRIVWTNACNRQILQHHYPFPDALPEDLSVPELERHTRHAYRLASWWLSSEPSSPAVFSEFDATNGTPVSDLRFVPGHDGRWLLSVSKGIWSIMSLWELSGAPGTSPVKRFEWSRRDCLLHAFLLNGDPASEGALAISVIQEGTTHVEIMSLQQDEGFRSISTCMIDSNLSPIYFHGDLLVLCDPADISLVMNWRTGASAILRYLRPPSRTGIGMNDSCIQVVVTPDSILVVRARALTLFPNPPLTLGPPAVHTHLAKHSYGWVDGVAVTTIVSPDITSAKPLYILIRPEPDDPWTAHAANIELYVLHPAEPDSVVPYIFPPMRIAHVPSTRGSLQCSALRFGPHGTAVWIQPQDRSAAGLYTMQDDAHAPVMRQNESLVCAAFPGPLFRRGEEEDLDAPVARRILCANELNNWKAVDYDEVRGLVAVGSTRGKITVLSLASPPRP